MQLINIYKVKKVEVLPFSKLMLFLENDETYVVNRTYLNQFKERLQGGQL
jgi:DNA-binding LytR/AlgR family response regulator